MAHTLKCGCIIADGKDTSVAKGYELGGYVKEFCSKHSQQDLPIPRNRDRLPAGETLESYVEKVLARWPNGSVTYREAAAVKRYVEQLQQELRNGEER